MPRNRLTIVGISAGIVFAVGFVMVNMVPGLGGTSTTKNFTDFYNSGGKRGAASLLGFVLVIGCWLMIWLFTELRARLANSVRSDVAYRLSIIGAAAVMIGGAVELGPTMVQNNQDNSDFVGVPIAHAFTQAGAGVVIIGLFTFAAAVLLFGLEFRRSTVFPQWLGTLSIVFAILLLGSFFVVPGFLLPIWAIIVGIAGRSCQRAAVCGKPAALARPADGSSDPINPRPSPRNRVSTFRSVTSYRALPRLSQTPVASRQVSASCGLASRGSMAAISRRWYESACSEVKTTRCLRC